MTTEARLAEREVVPIQDEVRDKARKQALLRAIGLDRATPEQREITVHIAREYGLDLTLRHVVLVDGKPYVTRDGYLHIAHRSGQLDGIEVSAPVLIEKYWYATASVYRKDMSRPFTYQGRYPAAGKNTAFAPEMAVKVAEVMSLRRAFDVSAPALEERWDVETVSTANEPPRPLAERVAQRASEIAGARTDTSEPAAPSDPEAGLVAPDDEPMPANAAAPEEEAGAAVLPPADPTLIGTEYGPSFCGAIPPDKLDMTAPCEKPAGHGTLHRSHEGSWPS